MLEVLQAQVVGQHRLECRLLGGDLVLVQKGCVPGEALPLMRPLPANVGQWT